MRRSLVMVVDDDDEYRLLLEETLEDEGYLVVSAASGRDALEYLRRGVRPTLLLLDLWMPGMDGWQLRLELTRDDALRDIPIVVVTGGELLPTADSMHVQEVISKPASPASIVAVVDRHVALAGG
jgi:CheY-like chemotaxis protein